MASGSAMVEYDPVKRAIIAIDGPSGAGKGTVARAVAERLGYRYVDTGAMYRASAWRARQLGVPLDDESRVAEIAERATIEVEGGVVRIDGQDVTRAIRTAEIDAAAAVVARHARVREALVRRQRVLGETGGIVMEGRDIGTVVFPAADVKIYLDAAPAERARRRAADPAHAAGTAGATPEAVASAIEARDAADRTRAVSPLAPAPDAVIVDTTHLTIGEVVQRVMAVIEKALSREGEPTNVE